MSGPHGRAGALADGTAGDGTDATEVAVCAGATLDGDGSTDDACALGGGAGAGPAAGGPPHADGRAQAQAKTKTAMGRTRAA